MSRLLFGFHAVQARLRSAPDSVEELYAEQERRDARMADLLEAAHRAGVRVFRVNRQRLDGLTGRAAHQGVVARLGDAPDLARHWEDLLDDGTEPILLLVLDGVQDPHNLGACLRLADAFGVHGVVVPKDRSARLTAVVSKVASGAAESVPLFPVTNLARALREMQDREVAVLGAHEEGAEEIYDMEIEGPVAWVLGAEGQGLRRLTRETCDRLVRIPMAGTVASLNVATAAAVCLFETRRQRVAQSRM